MHLPLSQQASLRSLRPCNLARNQGNPYCDPRGFKSVGEGGAWMSVSLLDTLPFFSVEAAYESTRDLSCDPGLKILLSFKRTNDTPHVALNHREQVTMIIFSLLSAVIVGCFLWRVSTGEVSNHEFWIYVFRCGSPA